MVPATPLLSAIVVIEEPLQIVCDDGVATALGIRLTVMVPVADPVPLPPVRVTV